MNMKKLRLEMLSAVATGFSTQVERAVDVQTGVSVHFALGSFSTHYPLLYLLPTYLLSFQLDSDEQSYRERSGFENKEALSNVHLLFCSDDTPPSYVDGSGFIIEFLTLEAARSSNSCWQ